MQDEGGKEEGREGVEGRVGGGMREGALAEGGYRGVARRKMGDWVRVRGKGEDWGHAQVKSPLHCCSRVRTEKCLFPDYVGQRQ